MKRILLCLMLSTGMLTTSSCDEVPKIRSTVSVPQLDVVAHDPVILKEGTSYYLFTTGPGVSVWKSEDMDKWTMQDPVFPILPDWTSEAVPGFKGHMWAPDISLRNGQYYLYYSVSTFGKNNSCIGLATNMTLDSSSPDFRWIDRGIVLQSHPNVDDWNAIDPNLVFDESGTPYLAFGSFWSGLKIVELTENLSITANPDVEPIPLASRIHIPVDGADVGTEKLTDGNTAIEGPFVYKRGDFYYLFASVDYCCRGADSTYKMVYGRSESLLGPYYDEKGYALLDGGGSLLAQGNERWHGVGHNSICVLDGIEYAVFHGYDGLTDRGVPKLRIELLFWTDDGWPYLELDQ